MVRKPYYPSLSDRKTLVAYVRFFWRDIVLLLVFFATMWIMQLLNRPYGTVRDLSIALDAKIPLLPWTVLIYNSWAPLILVLALFHFLSDRQLYRRYVFTMIIGQLMADLTFPFFQTVIPRPHEQVFAATDIFSKILAITYRADNNYCGFPSIHVILCTLTIFFIWKLKDAPGWLKVLVTFYFTAVAITTVTTKQHVVLDIPGGILYALVAIPIGIPVTRLIDRKCYREVFR